jgi:hypothetical protein
MWKTIGGFVVSNFSEVFVKELVKEVSKSKKPAQKRGYGMLHSHRLQRRTNLKGNNLYKGTGHGIRMGSDLDSHNRGSTCHEYPRNVVALHHAHEMSNIHIRSIVHISK